MELSHAGHAPVRRDAVDTVVVHVRADRKEHKGEPVGPAWAAPTSSWLVAKWTRDQCVHQLPGLRAHLVGAREHLQSLVDLGLRAERWDPIARFMHATRNWRTAAEGSVLLAGIGLIVAASAEAAAHRGRHDAWLYSGFSMDMVAMLSFASTELLDWWARRAVRLQPLRGELIAAARNEGQLAQSVRQREVLVLRFDAVHGRLCAHLAADPAHLVMDYLHGDASEALRGTLHIQVDPA